MKRFVLVVYLLIVLLFMIAVGTIDNEKELLTSSSPIPNITAKSCVAIDCYNNEILFEKNIHLKMLPASLTKVLTAYVSILYYDLDDYVIITNEMVNVEGSRIYLEIGDVISVKDLLYGLMLCSGNDAALALAYHYSGVLSDFMFLMNKVACNIGMANSYFENPHGLDGVTNNYTTAYDLAILFSCCMKNNTFREITKTKNYTSKIYSDRYFNFTNKHRLIKTLDNATGGKTGYTKKAGRTLITSFKDYFNEVVIVSLDAYDDWSLHKNLSEYAFSQIKRRDL